MSINYEVRRKMIKEIKEGDVLVAERLIGNGVVYFAVLQKSGVRMVISLPSKDKEGLIPARGIGGDLEISDDGEILSEDGGITIFSSTIVGVLKGVAENISQQFHKRIIPDSSIIKNKFSVDDDAQTRNTLSLINVLVSNMDYGKNKIALYEMFFRVISKSRSSKESALYLTHLLSLESELAEKLRQLEISKSIDNFFTQKSSLGNIGKQEAEELIEKVRKDN